MRTRVCVLCREADVAKDSIFTPATATASQARCMSIQKQHVSFSTKRKKHGIDCPIDIFHRRLLDAGKLKYYWSHPCTASQGSFNGLFQTSIDANRGKVFAWKAKRLYRKLLYFFR